MFPFLQETEMTLRKMADRMNTDADPKLTANDNDGDEDDEFRGRKLLTGMKWGLLLASNRKNSVKFPYLYSLYFKHEWWDDRISI